MEDYNVVSTESIVSFIYNQLTNKIDKDTIEEILDLELVYLESIGIATTVGE